MKWGGGGPPQKQSKNANPQMDNLLSVANVFGVSLDYLVGLTRSRSKNITDQYTSRKFGVSDGAMKVLEKYCKNQKIHYEDSSPSYVNNLRLINMLLEQEEKHQILSCIAGYLFGEYRSKDIDDPTTVEVYNEITGKSQRVRCDLIKKLHLTELQARLINLDNELEKNE